MKVWILTSEQNAWGQFGEYFVAVFGVKPDHTQLGLSGVPTNRLRHTLNGGGRVDDEDKWFHLRLHETQALRGTVRSSNTNGWLEAAVAWEVCASIHTAFAKGKDALFTTRHADFVKHAEDSRKEALAFEQPRIQDHT